jgi:hypothetical protein
VVRCRRVVRFLLLPLSAEAQGGPAGDAADPGMEVLHGAHIMRVKAAQAAGTTSNLAYHGGTGGVGVETGADKVYLVYWGSQWSNDPSGQASIQQSFFNGVGGSGWNNSVTQYCQGVPTGTTFCNGAGTAATNPSGVLAGYWYDSASNAPRSPRRPGPRRTSATRRPP